MKHYSTTRQILLMLSGRIKGKTLDAGGGKNAKYRSIISAHATEYVCMDVEAGGSVDMVGDVTRIPFPDRSFHTVVSTQVLEHVPAPFAAAQEFYRILQPGGNAIATAPFWEPTHADPGDYFRYTVDGLAALFESAGFVIVERGSYGGIFAVLASMIKFTWFNPYRRQPKIKRRAFPMIERVLLMFDRFVGIGRVYGGTYIVAQKPSSV